MEVILDRHVPLSIAVTAIRTCWDSHEKGGCYPEPTDNITEADQALMERVINKHKHASTSEHLVYNFRIKDVSRALLQELARHRIASYSVKSTRYTLKELKAEEPFTNFSCIEDGTVEWYTNDAEERAKKYLVFTGDKQVDLASILALENLRILLIAGIGNDKAKYCLPESYKTELTWSINARALKNFIDLRTSSAALWEIQDLANVVLNSLPESHKFLFQ